jgi:hypothetical protein
MESTIRSIYEGLKFVNRLWYSKVIHTKQLYRTFIFVTNPPAGGTRVHEVK